MIIRMSINSLLNKAIPSTSNTAAGEANHYQTHVRSLARRSFRPDVGWSNGLWAGCRSDAAFAPVGARNHRTGFLWFTSHAQVSSSINQFSDRFLFILSCSVPHGRPMKAPLRISFNCFCLYSYPSWLSLRSSGCGAFQDNHCWYWRCKRPPGWQPWHRFSFSS